MAFSVLAHINDSFHSQRAPTTWQSVSDNCWRNCKNDVSTDPQLVWYLYTLSEAVFQSAFVDILLKKSWSCPPLGLRRDLSVQDRKGKGGRVATFQHIHQRKHQFLLETEVTTTDLWTWRRGQQKKGFILDNVLHIYRLQNLRRSPSRQGKASFKPQTTSSLSPYLNISASLSKGAGHKKGYISLYPIKLATGGG